MLNVYGATITRHGKQWRIGYRYGDNVGSLLMPSLRQAKLWCAKRQLEYYVCNRKELKDGS